MFLLIVSYVSCLTHYTLCQTLPAVSLLFSPHGGVNGKKLAFMHEEGIGDPTVWLCEKWSQTQRHQQAHQNKMSGKLRKSYLDLDSLRHKTNMPKDKSLDAQQGCFLVFKTYLWEPKHYSSSPAETLLYPLYLSTMLKMTDLNHNIFPVLCNKNKKKIPF